MPRKTNSVQPRVASYFDSPSSALLGISVYDDQGNKIKQGEPGFEYWRHWHDAQAAHHHAQPPPVVHHHAPAPHAPHTSATGVSKNALRKSMAGYRSDLKKAYTESDAILRDHSQDWPGSDTLRLIQVLKKRASDKRHNEDAKWKVQHAPELKDMTAYVNAKKADPRSPVRNPHPGIHMKRVEHLHEQTIHVTAKELEDIATEVDKLVKKYRVTDELTNEPPTHSAAGRNEFYIFSILRYMAREKYRYVQAIEKWLTHMPADERTPKQKEYMRLYSEITSIKRRMQEARDHLKALSAGKTRKPRPPRTALPDDNNPPRQQPVHRVMQRG